MNVETRFRWATYFALVAFVITRAPTLIEDGKVFDLPLGINVGYVVLFGPTIILLFYADTYRASLIAERIKDRAIGPVFAVIAWMPAVLSLLIAAQYFLLVRKVQDNCGKFPSELFDWDAFQAVYCIRVGEGIQDKMPWLMSPPLLNSLLQLIAVCLSAWLAARTIALVRSRARCTSR